MVEKFDPYYKWLGIPRQEQPPNHYRLLGLSLLESDAEVIDAAASRSLAYIQGCATGEHIELSQKLLNEIAAARLCLLSSTRKAAYDAGLVSVRSRAELAVAAIPPPVVAPTPTPPKIVQPPALPDDSLSALLSTEGTTGPRGLLPRRSGQMASAIPPPLLGQAIRSNPVPSHSGPGSHAAPRGKIPSQTQLLGGLAALALALVIGWVLYANRGPATETSEPREAKSSSNPTVAKSSPAGDAKVASANPTRNAASNNHVPSNAPAPLARPSSQAVLDVITDGGEAQKLDELLAGGANVDSVDAEGHSAIRLAVTKHRPDLVGVLLNHRADVTLADARGETPLMSAVQQKAIDLVIVLLGAGARVNVRTAETMEGPPGGITALHIAARQGSSEIVTVLMLANADPEFANQDGVTPLMVACWQGKAATVEALLNYRANPNAVDAQGQTPLMFAAASGNIECVQLLLRLGAQVNAKNNEDLTALDFALEQGHDAIVNLLKQAAASDKAASFQ